MSVRAKLMLTSKTESKWSEGCPAYVSLKFTAQYDDTIPEDRRFARATPQGAFEMQVDNPAALARFELGKSYYFDITPAG